MIKEIEELNRDPQVNGILVQLPLPPHISEEAVIETISPAKDADGLHSRNLARLFLNSSQPYLVPCTPLGCLELIRSTGMEIAGKQAVVVGRSRLVGKPMAALLTNHDATVSVCHSKTQQLEEVVRRADILVVATGCRGLIRGHWIKEASCVIDVGISQHCEGDRKRVSGDVCFEEAVERAGSITPVPGGVGPMTVAMLLQNTHSTWVN